MSNTKEYQYLYHISGNSSYNSTAVDCGADFLENGAQPHKGIGKTGQKNGLYVHIKPANALTHVLFFYDEWDTQSLVTFRIKKADICFPNWSMDMSEETSLTFGILSGLCDKFPTEFERVKNLPKMKSLLKKIAKMPQSELCLIKSPDYPYGFIKENKRSSLFIPLHELINNPYLKQDKAAILNHLNQNPHFKADMHILAQQLTPQTKKNITLTRGIYYTPAKQTEYDLAFWAYLAQNYAPEIAQVPLLNKNTNQPATIRAVTQNPFVLMLKRGEHEPRPIKNEATLEKILFVFLEESAPMRDAYNEILQNRLNGKLSTITAQDRFYINSTINTSIKYIGDEILPVHCVTKIAGDHNGIVSALGKPQFPNTHTR